MIRQPVHHPQTEELLLFIDGEMPRISRASIRRHLDGCWKCRSEVEQLQQTVSEFMRYKQKLEVSSEPISRHTGAELRQRMEQMDRDLAGAPAGERVRSWLGLSAMSGVRRTMLGIFALAGTALAVMLAHRVIPQIWPDRAVQPAVAPHPKPATPGVAVLPGAPVVASPVLKARAAEPAPPPEPAPPLPTMSPEVAAWVKLHDLGADLGEPVDVVAAGRGGAAVICRQLGPQREAEIRAALAGVAGVTVRTEQGGDSGYVRPSRAVIALGSGTTPLDPNLLARLGGRATFDNLANQILDADDSVMARVHAIRGIEERFPTDRLAALAALDRKSVERILDDHRLAVREAGRRMEGLLAPVLRAMNVPAQSRGALSGASLFHSAVRLDRVVNTVFGGSPTSMSAEELAVELAAARAQFAEALEAIR